MTTLDLESVISTDVAAPPPTRSRWERTVRGRADDPVWVRPALLAVLAGTALLYIWGLGASGWANSFYSAAVEAGTRSWKAFFFGSFDSSNFITVDKPPASLWVMELSARVFGVNSWSILVPQALEGVAAVGLLYATVRRRFGASAGLIAGAVLASTPVATLMFRYNNPDALLVLLLVAAAYAVTRALEDTKTRWLVVAGVLVGFGFITKMMQAFLVVPGFGLVYLIYAQTTIRRRVMQLFAALGGIVAGAGWWVLAVSFTPAADRPYVGGSSDNSIWNLIFGYNGFGRLSGNETGSVGGTPNGAGGSMWGATGLHRLFNADFGGQISWLLPAALVLIVAAFVGLRRAGRADGRQAQVGLWASWLVVTALVISLSKGIIHPYYTVALAPAIGALVGIGAVLLWHAHDELWARVALAGTLLLSAWWSHHLLARSPDWHPWVRNLVIGVGVVAALAALAPPSLWRRLGTHSRHALGAAAIVVGLAGPLAYSLDTASTAYAGALPSAGPTVQGGGFGPGGRGGPGGFASRGGPGGLLPPAFGGTGGTPFGNQFGGPGGTGGTSRGGAGGLLSAGTVSSALTAALQADASSYTWVAATVGSENASGYQLAADEPVMSIGGFNGSDPAPSLAAFQTYVSAGKIHYFIPGGGFGGPGGGQAGRSSSVSAQITAWVEANFTSATIDGQTLYDLTNPAASAAGSAAATS